MVNVLDKQGKPEKIATSASRRQSRILSIIYDDTTNYLLGKAKSIPALWELKNRLKAEPNNPYGMKLTKGHTNAQVHSDCLKLRANGFIEAKEFGRYVVYYSAQAYRDVVSSTKDKKVLEKIAALYKVLQDMPRKATYY